MTMRPVTTEGKLLARIADSLDELVGILRPELAPDENPQVEQPADEPEPKKAPAKKTAQRPARKVTGT